MRHLRLEQFNRYFAQVGQHDTQDGPTLEDTVVEDEDVVKTDKSHKHYDTFSEITPAGTVFPSAAIGVEASRRRKQTRLAVSRIPFIEPLADQRETFYQQKLLLGLAWYCARTPEDLGSSKARWHFQWDPPTESQLGVHLQPLDLALGTETISFEQHCSMLESLFCRKEYNLICHCCLEESGNNLVCDSCKFAVGFHRCEHHAKIRWRKGTLFAGELDAQRCLFNLHRRGCPTQALHEKADEFIDNGLLRAPEAASVIRTIEQERSVTRVINDVGASDNNTSAAGRISSNLSSQELSTMLAERETKLQASDNGSPTDQWRVYSEIVDGLSTGKNLRVLCQASAGTGSFCLLTTDYA